MNNSSVLIVAHPDDEVLWLSSVLAHVQRIVICFGDFYNDPELSRRRAAAVNDLPLTNLTHLAIPEAGVFEAVDWSQPVVTESGLEITDEAAGERYETNYHRLLTELPPLLEGAEIVYTHNPWGEYGHADHVQVHHAVRALQQRFGYELAFSNYISKTSERLAKHIAADFAWDTRQRLATNRRLAKRLRDVYLRHGIWTWTPRHRWPLFETLFTRGAGSVHSYPSLTGKQVLRIEGLRWPPPLRHLRHRARHRLAPPDLTASRANPVHDSAT